jgi:hypothetical protein
MLQCGFAPGSLFSVIDWLAKLCPLHVDRVVDVFAAIVQDPRANRCNYLTQKEAIRSILNEGRTNGTAATIERVREIVSFLASMRETSYLDLVRSPAMTAAGLATA